jgi:hypothetical protein
MAPNIDMLGEHTFQGSHGSSLVHTKELMIMYTLCVPSMIGTPPFLSFKYLTSRNV